ETKSGKCAPRILLRSIRATRLAALGSAALRSIPAGRRWYDGRSLPVLLPQLLQDAFAQQVGIALPRLGQLDDAPGDDLVGAIAGTGNSQRHARHLERDTHDALGLRVAFEALQERRNRHERPGSRVRLPRTKYRSPVCVGRISDEGQAAAVAGGAMRTPRGTAPRDGKGRERQLTRPKLAVCDGDGKSNRERRTPPRNRRGEGCRRPKRKRQVRPSAAPR